MRKFWFYIAIVVLLIICTFLYLQYDEAMKTKNILLELNQQNVNKVSELVTHKKDRLHEMNFSGKYLPKNCLIFDEEGNSLTLSELVRESSLILRYSNLNCNTCIDEQIKNLNQYADSIGIDNIFLLTTYDIHVHMSRFRKINKIKIPIFNLSKELNTYLEDIGSPYFFILNKSNMRINNMYVPQKEIPQLTTIYLSSIKEKYFSQ